MHASELVELGALAAAHGPALVALAPSWSPAALERYWAAGKFRLDSWGRALGAYSREVQSAPHARQRQLWRQVRPVLEEILTGEVLGRVWTAVMCLCDQERGNGDAEPVARSVYIGQMEARNRALNILVYGQGFDLHEAVALNQIRRRSERWTDLLLGSLLLDHDVTEFAFDADRAREFAHDLREEGGLRGLAWQMTMASLRAAFSQDLSPQPASPELNRQLASAVVELLPEELFDSLGAPHSLWMVRMTNLTDDTQGLVEEFLAPDPPGRLRRFGWRRI
ncbi:MAG: hypothetical protein KY475_05795 [Planctomycetes bacterium]|nr:hypothetical protein [Planctomycetota bacterium]